MTRKPLIAAAALAAVVAVPTGAVAATGATSAAKPAVSDLDVDLVRGSTFVMTVEARRARTVKLTYRGQTKTARLDPDDGDDRDRDYVARFTAASGDRVDDKRISVKVTATKGSRTTTKTLTDRVDVEDDDD